MCSSPPIPAHPTLISLPGSPAWLFTSPKNGCQLPLAWRIVCHNPPFVTMTPQTCSSPLTPAQPTAEKGPGLLVWLFTSPKNGCQLPLAWRIVCHIPPPSVTPQTCTSPLTPAQPTAEKGPGVLVWQFTSPKNGCQLPWALPIVGHIPPRSVLP